MSDTESAEPKPVPFLVFETPGELDLRAITLMGVSAKPNHTNPIGFFGTGLKYAIASLLRMDADLVIHIGRNTWTFHRQLGEFRGSEITQLEMQRHRGKMLPAKVVPLPFAMDYGKTWEPWMVFRELEANTRDEKGWTYLDDQDPGVNVLGNTRIVVRHPDIVTAYEKRDEVFHPAAEREGSGIQAMAGESDYLYYRGMRVLKLGRPSKLTYNFLDRMLLTEDRTLASEYDARSQLGIWTQRHEDEHTVETVISAGEKYWEHSILLNEFVAPSRAFHNVALRNPKNTPSGYYGYYAQHDERVTVATFKLDEAHPFPWSVEGRHVVDGKGRKILEAPYGYIGKWEIAAAEIIRRLGMAKAVADETVSDLLDVDKGIGSQYSAREEMLAAADDDEMVPF